MLRNALGITAGERRLAVQMCLHSKDDRPETRLKIGSFSPQNGRFWAVFRKIVLKVQDDRRYAKQVFPMRAVVFSWRLGYPRMANGCSIRRVPHRGATRWSILR